MNHAEAFEAVVKAFGRDGLFEAAMRLDETIHGSEGQPAGWALVLDLSLEARCADWTRGGIAGNEWERLLHGSGVLLSSGPIWAATRRAAIIAELRAARNACYASAAALVQADSSKSARTPSADCWWSAGPVRSLADRVGKLLVAAEADAATQNLLDEQAASLARFRERQRELEANDRIGGGDLDYHPAGAL